MAKCESTPVYWTDRHAVSDVSRGPVKRADYNHIPTMIFAIKVINQEFSLDRKLLFIKS